VTIEEVVYGMLTGAQAVRESLSDRIYPGQAPDSAEFPLAVYSDAETVPSVTHDGAGTSDRHQMDFEVWALDYASAKRAARAIRGVLHGYRGTLHGYRIQGMWLETEADRHELPQHADERGFFGVAQSYGMAFRPAEQGGVNHGG
jgi:hypothetical protein